LSLASRALRAAVLSLGLSLPALALAQMPNPYGPTIPEASAKKAAEAAIAEARKNGWTMAVAIVDPAGTLLRFERIDNTQVGSSHVAIQKAVSSATFKRPTKAFEDALRGPDGQAVAVGRLAILGLSGAVPLEGGLPIVVDGKIIGAIGVSGGTSQQDGVAAKAGVDALAAPAK
jgi:uncharacterized protein GlcG (DUF336 family)